MESNSVIPRMQVTSYSRKPAPRMLAESSWPLLLGLICIPLALLGCSYPLGEWSVLGQAYTLERGVPPSMVFLFHEFKPVWHFLLLSTFVASSALLVAGIGLTIRRRWAPTLCVLFAVAKIPIVLCSLAVGYLFRCQTAPLIDAPLRGGPVLLGLHITVLGAAILVAWKWALPVFLLVWFSREEVGDEVEAWD
ncbi:MAG: hypothetical protein AB1714_08715 [Acidobacteriota bacterium]